MSTPTTESAPGTSGEPTPPRPNLALDGRTWREVAYLLANLPCTIVGFVYAVTLLALGGGLAVTVIGLPLLALALGGARLLGRFERGRARRLLGVRVDEPSRLPRGKGGGLSGCGRRCGTRSAGGRCSSR